jgi:hypothetical protein
MVFRLWNAVICLKKSPSGGPVVSDLIIASKMVFMKKILVTAIVLITANVLIAQNHVEFGIKGGVNLASLNFDNNEDFNTRTSFHLGGWLTFTSQSNLLFNRSLCIPHRVLITRLVISR